MNVLDLFSGIGGFSLGLERAGMRTVAFCEIEPYPRAVLRKHWPTIPCYDDIRTLTADRLKADNIGTIDVICGGFPCQDISVAGKGAGLAGERSGLWREYARLIGEIRPRFVIVENVAALLGRGLSTVLGDLAEIGYDAEWRIISAADVGAPHLRERVWIVGYPEHIRQTTAEISEGIITRGNSDEAGTNQAVEFTRPSEQYAHVADASLCVRGDALGVKRNDSKQHEPCERSTLHADTNGERLERPYNYTEPSQRIYQGPTQFHQEFSNPASIGQSGQGQPVQWVGETAHRERKTNILESVRISDQWPIEPNVGRVANGVPARVDRLKGLGNAVVPQIPEIIGKAIMAYE